MYDEDAEFDMEFEIKKKDSFANVNEEFEYFFSQWLYPNNKKNLLYYLAKSLYESGSWDSIFPHYELGIIGAVLQSESTWVQFFQNFVPQFPLASTQKQAKSAVKTRKINTRARTKRIGLFSKKKSILPSSFKNEDDVSARYCLETLQTRMMVALFDIIVDNIFFSQKNAWDELLLSESTKDEFNFFDVNYVMEPYFTLEDYIEVKESNNVAEAKRCAQEFSFPFEFPPSSSGGSLTSSLAGRKAKKSAKSREVRELKVVLKSSRRCDYLNAIGAGKEFKSFIEQLDVVVHFLKDSGLLVRPIFKNEDIADAPNFLDVLNRSSMDFGVLVRSLEYLVYFSKSDFVRDLNAMFSNLRECYKDDYKVLEQVEDLTVTTSEALEQVPDQTFSMEKERFEGALFEVFPDVYSQLQEDPTRRYLFYREDPALTSWKRFLAEKSGGDEEEDFFVRVDDFPSCRFHSSYSPFVSWNSNHVLANYVLHPSDRKCNRLIASYMERNRIFVRRALDYFKFANDSSCGVVMAVESGRVLPDIKREDLSSAAHGTEEGNIWEQKSGGEGDEKMEGSMVMAMNSSSGSNANNANRDTNGDSNGEFGLDRVQIKVEKEEISKLPPIGDGGGSLMQFEMQLDVASVDRSTDGDYEGNGSFNCEKGDRDNGGDDMDAMEGGIRVFSPENSEWDVPPLAMDEVDLVDSLDYEVSIEFLKQSIAIKLIQGGFETSEGSCCQIFSEVVAFFIERIGFSISNFNLHYDPMESIHLALMEIMPNGIESLRDWLVRELIGTDNCLRTTSEARLLSWCDVSVIREYKKANGDGTLFRANLMKQSTLMKAQSRSDFMLSIANVNNSVGGTGSLHLIVPSSFGNTSSHFSGTDSTLSVSDLTMGSAPLPQNNPNIRVSGANLKGSPIKRSTVSGEVGVDVGTAVNVNVGNNGCVNTSQMPCPGPMVDLTDHIAGSVKAPITVNNGSVNLQSSHHETNQSMASNISHQWGDGNGHSTPVSIKGSVKGQSGQQYTKVYTGNQLHLNAPLSLPPPTSSTNVKSPGANVFNSPNNIIVVDKQIPNVYYSKISINQSPMVPGTIPSKLDGVKIPPFPGEINLQIPMGSRDLDPLPSRRKTEKRKRMNITDEKSGPGRKIRTRRLSSHTNYSEEYYYDNEDQILEHGIDREPVKKKRKNVSKK